MTKKHFIIPIFLIPFVTMLFNVLTNGRDGWIKLAAEGNAVICGIPQAVLCKSAIDLGIYIVAIVGIALYGYGFFCFMQWLEDRYKRKLELQKKRENEACGNH